MLDSFSRHRSLVVLASVLIAQVVLLAFQVKRERNVRLLRFWTVELLMPAERAGSWTISKTGGFWHAYIGLREAHQENDQLHAELDQLRLRNRQLQSEAAEGQRLAALLNFREAHPEASLVAAQVIGASADPSSHTRYLNRGERDRVRRNLVVITPDGVVGKVVEVFPTTCQVLLITDKESGVGALFADTRTHGVVKGTGDPQPRMEYVVNEEKVQVGEPIVTSGDDRIFPKDLPIGTVASATSGNTFQTIRVQPAARLDRLEEVFILFAPPEMAPKKMEATSASAASPPSGTVPTASPAPGGVVSAAPVPRKHPAKAVPKERPAAENPVEPKPAGVTDAAGDKPPSPNP